MAIRFKQLSKTSTEWTSLNPTLLEGEIGFESDTNKLKVGNGVDTWNDLEYVTGSSSDLDTSNLVDLTSDQIITGVKTFITTEGEFGTGYFPIVISNQQFPGIKFSAMLNNSLTNELYIGNTFLMPNAKGIGLGFDINFNGSITNYRNINIGYSVSSNSDLHDTIEGNSIVIGQQSSCTHGQSIIMGYLAKATQEASIQLGTGTNNNAKTFQVWDYQLLDGNTGLIPNDRLDLGIKKYLHRITLNLSDQASGSPPNKTAVIHLDYYSEQETAYTSPNFATLALTNSIGCSGYYIDADVSLTEKNFVYEIALPQSNEFILNNNVSITIQSTGSSITDEVIGYVLS